MKKVITFGCILLLLLEMAGLSQSNVFEVRVKGSREWGYANLDGEVIIEPKFAISNEFSENGLALVAPIKQYVIIDLEGNTLEVEIEPLEVYRDPWRGAPIYNDGLLRITRNNKWGALNTLGKLSIPFKYDYLTDFNGGFAIAEVENKFLVIDKEGNETPISDPTIKGVKHFTEDLAPCKGKRNKWGFINSNGEVAITPQYSSVGYFSGGLAWAKGENGKYGYIDIQGNWVINPRFISVHNFDAESGMALVMLGDKNYYVNKSGSLSNFKQTSKLYKFSDGLAIARWNEKIGFINNNMEWVVPPKYTAARPFHNGYAAVKLNSRWGIIDKEGTVVLEPTFMDIREVTIIN
jgi:hypothetical protein